MLQVACSHRSADARPGVSSLQTCTVLARVPVSGRLPGHSQQLRWPPGLALPCLTGFLSVARVPEPCHSLLELERDVSISPDRGATVPSPVQRPSRDEHRVRRSSLGAHLAGGDWTWSRAPPAAERLPAGLRRVLGSEKAEEE